MVSHLTKDADEAFNERVFSQQGFGAGQLSGPSTEVRPDQIHNEAVVGPVPALVDGEKDKTLLTLESWEKRVSQWVADVIH